ncbi:transcription termination factor 3, mitochondrial isoform X2 [Brienomyrus brachyistius]|uniref:transcription termination factor 3, mitochondrial isoform X2 n=1 Tax=Brienomyrus brachyistius TaxID=42636 RepID=UPI0020B3D1C8|nr:transcription termination factor 3, mitochondrial isoform X2 [Brienomyrus brachyistius]
MDTDFLMALGGLHLCKKCSFFLGVRKLCSDLQQSARFLHSANVQFSSIPQSTFAARPACGPAWPVGITGRFHKPPQTETWKVTVCQYSDTTGVTLAGRDNQQLPADPAQTGLISKQSLFGTLPLSDSQAPLLDLDGSPPLAPFEEISEEEAVQIHAAPALPTVSVSLGDYVDRSETLQQLLKLGVNLSKLEQRPNVGSMLLRLDFHADVKDRLLFLKDVGVGDSRLGTFITHNPFILTEGLENLRARATYLRSKKFSRESVATMVSKAPYLLNFSIERLDNRLNFYQQTLGLSTEKTRNLVVRLPGLLCRSLEPVKENLKVCELELGFRPNEIQHIVTAVPKVLTANKKKLTEIFNYVHNTMGIPHALITKFPQVFNSRLLRIRERHLFLQYLQRAQYDPAKPSYISLHCFVSLPDRVFCSDVAKATLEDFELFQKTL